MDIYFKEISPDELWDELMDLFTQVCRESECKMDSDNDEKEDKKNTAGQEPKSIYDNTDNGRYYSNSTCGSDYDIDSLKNLLSEKYREIDRLKKENDALKNSGDDMSKSQARICNDYKVIKSALENILCKELAGMESRLRLYIDYTKKFGLDTSRFKEAMEMVRITANDYVLSSVFYTK